MDEKEIRKYCSEGHPPQIVKLIDKILEGKLETINERLNRLWAAYVAVIKKQSEEIERLRNRII